MTVFRWIFARIGWAIQHTWPRLDADHTWDWCHDHPDLIDRSGADWAAIRNISKEK
jgi:hypothetical protein